MEKKYNLIFDSELMDVIYKFYGSQGKGINRITNNWFLLRRTVMPGLQGRFTYNEMGSMVKVLNGMNIDTRLAVKDVLIFAVQDAEKYDKMLSEWGVIESDLVDKLEKLTAVESMFLVDEIYRFWNVKSAYGSPNPNIERFAVDWGCVG
jgi:hypothetical protein